MDAVNGRRAGFGFGSVYNVITVANPRGFGGRLRKDWSGLGITGMSISMMTEFRVSMVVFLFAGTLGRAVLERCRTGERILRPIIVVAKTFFGFGEQSVEVGKNGRRSWDVGGSAKRLPGRQSCGVACLG